jgi:hypothetical protein
MWVKVMPASLALSILTPSAPSPLGRCCEALLGATQPEITKHIPKVAMTFFTLLIPYINVYEKLPNIAGVEGRDSSTVKQWKSQQQEIDCRLIRMSP